MVETFGTARIPEDRISRAIRDTFDMRPAMIIKTLDLLRPIYCRTAALGHFGREIPEFTWERTDKVSALRKNAG
jgi:S-adenosylmethionine synthetase